VKRWFARGFSMALVLLSLVLFLSQVFDNKLPGKLTSFPYLGSLGFLIVSFGFAVWVRRRDVTPQLEPSEGGGARSIGGIIPGPRAPHPERPTDAGVED